MKERNFGLTKVFWCCAVMVLPGALFHSATATETRLQGWEVNQGTIINLLNMQSRVETPDDEMAELLADTDLIPVFQSLKVLTPEMNGFRGSASITQFPPGNGNVGILSDHKSARQLQARASYSSIFEKGSVNLWLGALWKETEIRSITTGFQSDNENFGYNMGIDLSYAGFSVTGSYYTGQAIDSIYLNPYYAFESSNCPLGTCAEFNNEGYVLRGAYAFTQATRLGISYGESSHFTGMNVTPASDSELWSVGLYHNVNSWLKIMAEYSNFKSSNYGFEEDSGMISVGGYLRW